MWNSYRRYISVFVPSDRVKSCWFMPRVTSTAAESWGQCPWGQRLSVEMDCVWLCVHPINRNHEISVPPISIWHSQRHVMDVVSFCGWFAFSFVVCYNPFSYVLTPSEEREIWYSILSPPASCWSEILAPARGKSEDQERHVVLQSFSVRREVGQWWTGQPY